MKQTQTDKKLEALGFKLYLFKRSPHIIEYINETNGLEIKFNTWLKSVRLKRHWLGADSEFECDKVLIDLISAKMLELL